MFVYMYDFIQIIKGKRSSIWGQAWEGFQVGKYLAKDGREERGGGLRCNSTSIKTFLEKEKNKKKEGNKKGKEGERKGGVGLNTKWKLCTLHYESILTSSYNGRLMRAFLCDTKINIDLNIFYPSKIITNFSKNILHDFQL